MKKARFPTCEVSESGFFKVCEFPEITSGVQTLIDLQLRIIDVMSTPFGISSLGIIVPNEMDGKLSQIQDLHIYHNYWIVT